MALAVAGVDPRKGNCKGGSSDSGTMGFSTGGGVYTYVRAAGVITGRHMVSIEANFDADLVDSSGQVHGTMYGLSEATFADNEYGWLKVWGLGDCRYGGTVTAGAALTLDGSDDGKLIAATVATPQVIGLHAVVAGINNNYRQVQLTFPKNRS